MTPDGDEIEVLADVPVFARAPGSSRALTGRVRSRTEWVVLDALRGHLYDTRTRGSRPDDPGWHPCSCGWEGYWTDWQPHVAEKVVEALRIADRALGHALAHNENATRPNGHDTAWAAGEVDCPVAGPVAGPALPWAGRKEAARARWAAAQEEAARAEAAFYACFDDPDAPGQSPGDG